MLKQDIDKYKCTCATMLLSCTCCLRYMINNLYSLLCHTTGSYANKVCPITTLFTILCSFMHIICMSEASLLACILSRLYHNLEWKDYYLYKLPLGLLKSIHYTTRTTKNHYTRAQRKCTFFKLPTHQADKQKQKKIYILSLKI